MNTTLTVDKAGRVVLPKPVRDQLQLVAGDSLELESSEHYVVLRPVRGKVGMRKKQGIWVLDVDAPLSLDTVNRATGEVQEEREKLWRGQREPSSEHPSAGGWRRMSHPARDSR